MEHLLNGRLLQKRIAVHLIGVGGGGAQMAGCLARLDIALRAQGHPHGLSVCAWDPAKVRAANVGRQVYSPSDIGQYKAIVTIERLNQFYGLNWRAVPETAALAWDRHAGAPDIIISCVDTRAARRHIHQRLFDQPHGVSYWLDLGNREADGQVWLGQPPRTGVDPAWRLPCITELYPEILEPRPDEDAAPSCSLRMALASQGLFVNDMAVRYGAQLLYRLFSTGRLAQHAALFNLDSLCSAGLAVDRATWLRFGVERPAPPEPVSAPAPAPAAAAALP
ncbi:PRTRC system ThiF family protein [Rugamonas aquatica]|uniref:PRTRC system ThiF family protein n=1 Tax=Rugamonas aquatica TaxID=2743357 RepID=A0A6A7N6R8_9BURK|nr:PRTRC system ThiF family protein [Rugamonas aquatica]MQA40572.1 PRTRC system ThiF family protein [Rugamonas aquatica]